MGSYAISIRDTKPLQDSLRGKGEIEVNDQVKHNANAILRVIKNAHAVLPELKKISDKDKETISKGVAYLMRTDLVIPHDVVCFGPMRFNPNMLEISRTDSPSGARNDVTAEGLSTNSKGDVLTRTGIRLYDIFEEEGLQGRAQEFFRCYVGTLTYMDLFGKLDPKHRSLGPAFKLAEVTAYLLNTQDLVEYTYSKEEIERYFKELDEDIASA